MGVHDKRVLAIIKEMLTAGYIESEVFYDTDTGTIQGGIISPLLANVYLTSFDWMIGKMYLYPKHQRCNYLESDRKRMKKQGVIPKYLIRYADDKVHKCAKAVFKKKYSRNYRQYKVSLDKLSNRPQRHKGYRSITFAVKHEGMHIGITKAFLTHSQWETYCFNQKITPYAEEGRKLYLKNYNGKKKFPMDRPPLYDVDMLIYMMDGKLNNFEYYMNREYAYNRDRGKCMICGCYLNHENRNCHRIDEGLPIYFINKVPNLAWLCKNCNKYVHGNELPQEIKSSKIKKIEKYRAKLN